MNVFYSTTNGERDGRASNFFKAILAAEVSVDHQNKKAEEMGIKSRYAVASCDDSTITDTKSIR